MPRRSSSARTSWAMRAPPTWTTSPRSIRSARCFARSLVMTRLSVLVLGFLASCDGLRLILRSPSRPGATRTSSGGLADQACDREPQTLFVVCPVLDPPERDEYFSRARYAKPAVGGERVREHEVVRPDDMPGRPLEARVGVRVVDGDALLVLTCQDDVSEQLDRPALDAEALHCLLASVVVSACLIRPRAATPAATGDAPRFRHQRRTISTRDGSRPCSSHKNRTASSSVSPSWNGRRSGRPPPTSSAR